jgi:nucleoside-diphosphate-sugar epimerase
MNILITGGAGYIGSTLTPLLLEAGHRVRVLDALLFGGRSLLGVWGHPEFEFQRGDVRDPAAVRAALDGMDAVVHLAAIVGDPACSRKPELARETNLTASLCLLDECLRNHIGALVFASTCSNYGRMADGEGFVDEQSPLAPVSLYAETKVMFERMLLDLPAGETALCATPLRFATVYGVSPRMRFDLTVNEFTRDMIVHGRLTIFGEQFWRPYIHVRDAARAIAMVLRSEPAKVRGQVFNVGCSDQNFQKRKIAELVRERVGCGTVEYVHRDEDPRDYRVSFARIATQLGFQTTRAVEWGIREVADLIRAQVMPSLDDVTLRN